MCGQSSKALASETAKGGGPHPKEGEQGGHVDKGLRKKRSQGRRGQVTQSRHGPVSHTLHSHPAMLCWFYVAFIRRRKRED